MFQIVHFQKILEGHCLNKSRLTAPLYIFLGMGGIVIDIWEKSNFFGSIGSQKCTKNAIYPQGGLLKPPLPQVGLSAGGAESARTF